MRSIAQRGFGLPWLFGAVALVGSLGLLYWRIDSAAYERGSAAVRQEWQAANDAARAREAAASAKAAADLAAERKKRRVVVQTITKEVDREVLKPVYRDVCLPDRGLCLANAAILGTVDAGCFADGAVPATKPD